MELTIGAGEVFGGDDRLCAAPEELGPVRPQSSGQLVQLLHEVVVELYEHFTSSHDHMITPMVDWFADDEDAPLGSSDTIAPRSNGSRTRKPWRLGR